MIPYLTIDDSRGQAMLNDLRAALIGQGKMGDAATILEDEFRLLLKQIITLTPPHGLGQSARQQGEEAIKKDLSKIFTPVDEEMLNIIGSQFGIDGIDQWITDTDGSKKHLVWDHLDATGGGMEDWHNRNRDSRGRARNLKKKNAGQPFWYAPYVVSKDDFGPFLARLISHVGRRKAAWAESYQKLGGKVQRWIGRHLPSPIGRYEDRLQDRTKPSIAAYSSAPGVKEDQRIVSDALRVRREAMKKKLELVISDYSRNVANRIRITNKARRSPASLDATA